MKPPAGETENDIRQKQENGGGDEMRGRVREGLEKKRKGGAHQQVSGFWKSADV